MASAPKLAVAGMLLGNYIFNEAEITGRSSDRAASVATPSHP
jgi:hypothetical protein